MRNGSALQASKTQTRKTALQPKQKKDCTQGEGRASLNRRVASDEVHSRRGLFQIARCSKANLEHMTLLTNQLLTGQGLSAKWADTIMTIVRKISQVVRPDVRHEGDDMDVRQYVQVKKV